MAAAADDVERWRNETPGCRSRIHLNNCGAALPPEAVSRAVREHLELEQSAGGYEAEAARADGIRDFRKSAADLLRARPENVAFAPSATHAFAQALSAIPFSAGDRILTTRDDYVSNQIAFLSLERRLGLEVLRAPALAEGGVDPDAFGRLLDEKRPRLAAVTHVPTNSGLVQPVEAIGELCRERGVLYLVDACQSAGQMPLDVSRIGCDFLSAAGRKFLRGPRGTGFLFVSDRALAQGLEPLFPDMRGAEWTAPGAYRAAATALRFEYWETPVALLLGLGAALRYALGVGLETIEPRVRALADRLRQRLRATPGVRVLDRGSRLCGIVTLAIAGVPADAAVRALADRRIRGSVSRRAYAVIDFDEKGVEAAVRLSPHYYNTEEEIDAAADAVAELAESGGRLADSRPGRARAADSTAPGRRRGPSGGGNPRRPRR